MSFHILYVEDNERHQKMMEKALSEVNNSHPKRLDIKITCIDHPSEMTNAFTKNHDIDIVLADLFFDNPEADSLDDIINFVREWDKKSPHGFPTSIIAYTRGGGETLKKCFERRKCLYDIWHKLSANPDYVAWRFQGLQKELPRYRPDATIQRLIISMAQTECPSWHDKILLMVKGYGEGQTEREQIKRCRPQLLSILDNINSEHASAFIDLWDALVSSEPLLRAASPRLRGITRHSINVFWLGYWLINHSQLKGIFHSLWNNMLVQRRGNSLNSNDSMFDLNTVWLLSSLLHDAGKFHEYSKSTILKFSDFFNSFNPLGTGHPAWHEGNVQDILSGTNDLLFKIAEAPEDKKVQALKTHIEKCSNKDILP